MDERTGEEHLLVEERTGEEHLLVDERTEEERLHVEERLLVDGINSKRYYDPLQTCSSTQV